MLTQEERDRRVGMLYDAVACVNTACNGIEASKVKTKLTGLCFLTGLGDCLGWSTWAVQDGVTAVEALDKAEAIVKEAFTWVTDDILAQKIMYAGTVEEKREGLSQDRKSILALIRRLKKRIAS